MNIGNNKSVTRHNTAFFIDIFDILQRSLSSSDDIAYIVSPQIFLIRLFAIILLDEYIIIKALKIG
jgi:hypothetical protein